VGQLGVNVVIDIPLFKNRNQSESGRYSHGGKTHNVLRGSGTTEGEVLELGQYGPSLPNLLELIRRPSSCGAPA
jgi:hypothetical protein